MKKNYIAVLYEKDDILNVTNIDENSIELAEELFYGEFGYTKTPDKKILIEEEK